MQYGRGSGKNSVRMLLERLEPNVQIPEEKIEKVTQKIKEAGLVLKSLLPDSILKQIVREVLSDADLTSKEAI